MKQCIKSVKVKGYNKTHLFSIEKISVSNHTFYHLVKNGNVILNCTEREFLKMTQLFSGLGR